GARRAVCRPAWRFFASSSARRRRRRRAPVDQRGEADAAERQPFVDDGDVTPVVCLVDRAVRRHERRFRERVRLQRPFRRSADWTRVELLAAYQVAERFEIAGIVERSMRDERTVPYTVEIARARVVRIATARLLAEDDDRDAVAAALDAERVEWLMQIADQMHEELERDR